MSFEQALYEYVRDNFTVSSFPITEIGFGEVDAGTAAPYIAMFVLDSNGDPQVLCDTQFKSGTSFVQFNVYANDATDSFFIKRQLDLFLSTPRSLTLNTSTYRINNVLHEASPAVEDLTDGVSVDVLAKTYIYNEE